MDNQSMTKNYVFFNCHRLSLIDIDFNYLIMIIIIVIIIITIIIIIIIIIIVIIISIIIAIVYCKLPLLSPGLIQLCKALGGLITRGAYIYLEGLLVA